MSTYFIKGGSKFNEADPNVWVYTDLSGYPSGHYLDTDWKDIATSGAVGDPYWRLGGNGGIQQAEFGLYSGSRITITSGGIKAWDVETSDWVPLPLTGVEDAILATQQSIGLPIITATAGATLGLYSCQSVAILPAADNSCQANYSSYMPIGWEPMVNPIAVILFASPTSVDTWQLTVRFDASKEGESANTQSLSNVSLSFTSVGVDQWTIKEVQLTGTISPGDIIGCRLMKTSIDTRNLHIGATIWIKRA